MGILSLTLSLSYSLNVCKQGGFTPSSSESTPAEPPKPAYTAAPARKPTSSRAMKLGGNARDVDSFVDQLESEGVKVGSVGAPVKAAGGLSKVRYHKKKLILQKFSFLVESGSQCANRSSSCLIGGEDFDDGELEPP